MAKGDSKSVSVTIRCKGDGAIAAASEATSRFSGEAKLVGPMAARLAIVVEELAINVVEHGGLDHEGDFALALGLDEEGAVMIVLGDAGLAFDPRQVRAPEEIPERGGGAGLELVRAWAEILSYRSANGWNLLELRLPPG